MVKKSDESKLAKLKKDYKKLQEKYKLPSFEKLNEDFGIERASDSESDFTLKEIRKQISEKVYNYLRLVETLINPVNAPMSIMSIVKAFGVAEKEKLVEIYKKLVKSEWELIAIDLEFSEKKEAEFIREIYGIWQGVKKDVVEVIDAVSKNWERKTQNTNRKYFD
jgi:hypothetical protein